MIYRGYLNSQAGIVEIEANENELLKVFFVEEEEKKLEILNDLVINTKKELEEYFLGKRTNFSYHKIPKGTPFQMKVWQAMTSIKYGETSSYQDIAIAINNMKAVRAVGSAIGRNPLGIIIPCQRVINKNGNIGGYGMDVWRKKILLDLEKNNN